jgi:hypothetical protein
VSPEMLGREYKFTVKCTFAVASVHIDIYTIDLAVIVLLLRYLSFSE